MEPVIVKPSFEQINSDSQFFAAEICSGRPGEDELRKYQQLFQESTKPFQVHSGRKNCSLIYLSVVVDSEGVWLIVRFHEGKQIGLAKAGLKTMLRCFDESVREHLSNILIPLDSLHKMRVDDWQTTLELRPQTAPASSSTADLMAFYMNPENEIEDEDEVTEVCTDLALVGSNAPAVPDETVALMKYGELPAGPDKWIKAMKEKAVYIIYEFGERPIGLQVPIVGVAGTSGRNGRADCEDRCQSRRCLLCRQGHDGQERTSELAR